MSALRKADIPSFTGLQAKSMSMTAARNDLSAVARRATSSAEARRAKAKAHLPSADPEAAGYASRLTRPTSLPQSSSDRLAAADRAVGLPNTLRQPALRLALCRCMQEIIRALSGISDEQSRMTSPVQSRCASSSLAAWLDAGDSARQKAKMKAEAERILRLRIENK
jgi:hypothetical protein